MYLNIRVLGCLKKIRPEGVLIALKSKIVEMDTKRILSRSKHPTNRFLSKFDVHLHFEIIKKDLVLLFGPKNKRLKNPSGTLYGISASIIN